jgi:adenylate cyclase
MPAGIEVERKFVVLDRPSGLERHPHQRIEQGYLAVGEDGVEVRVRRRDDDDATLTVKSGPGLERVEEEIPIDARRFRNLWTLTDGRRLTKTRYLVPLDDGLAAEVDDYDGELAGLLTAEIEFPSVEASAEFQAPEWLGEEVTGDERYANRALAVDGRPGPDAQPAASR